MSDEWISVEYLLPERLSGQNSSDWVLVFNRYTELQRVDLCYYDLYPNDGFTSDVSHWMPLPTKPLPNNAN